MRVPAKSLGSLPLFRSAFRRRREPDWRPDLVSPEERIAAVLIVVLLATLVAAACAVYVLNRDKARTTAGPNRGIPAHLGARAAQTARLEPSQRGLPARCQPSVAARSSKSCSLSRAVGTSSYPTFFLGMKPATDSATQLSHWLITIMRGRIKPGERRINVRTEDDDAMILCGGGVRESRKSCAFCADRAIVQCDGDRCVRQLCNGHRWSPAEDLDLCPSCEHKLLVAAATPKQIEFFR
jgi:hypothetical protein